MFPVSILTGALTAFAQKKNPEKSYFFERGAVGLGAYVVHLMAAISHEEGRLLRVSPGAALIAPAFVTVMKMGFGHIIGGVAYDCVEENR